MCKILISLIFSVISYNLCDVSCVNSMNYLGRTKDEPKNAQLQKVRFINVDARDARDDAPRDALACA